MGDSNELINEDQELCLKGKENCCTALWFLFPHECVALYCLPDLNYKFLQGGSISLAYKVISKENKMITWRVLSRVFCVVARYRTMKWWGRKRGYSLIFCKTGGIHFEVLNTIHGLKFQGVGYLAVQYIILFRIPSAAEIVLKSSVEKEGVRS